MLKRRSRLRLTEDEIEEKLVKVNRCAKVVKGGRRFSFSALVVVGNGKGVIGYGHGKANEVPFAIRKAKKDALKNLIKIPLKNNTIPHTVQAKYCATRVIIRPACEGTGVIAGAALKAVLELAGVKDALTKIIGSSNPGNAIRCAFEALKQLRSKQEIEQTRGVKIV